MFKALIVASMSLVFSGTIHAQSFHQSTITWVADRAIDLERTDTVAMKCSFKTVGGAQLIWSQRNGSINSTYQITGVEGTWSNISEQGSVNLTLQRNGKSSKAKVERTNDGVYIMMDFSKPEGSSHLLFRIVTIQ